MPSLGAGVAALGARAVPGALLRRTVGGPVLSDESSEKSELAGGCLSTSGLSEEEKRFEAV
jgi:hypothetical protein